VEENGSLLSTIHQANPKLRVRALRSAFGYHAAPTETARDGQRHLRAAARSNLRDFFAAVPQRCDAYIIESVSFTTGTTAMRENSRELSRGHGEKGRVLCREA